MKNWVYLSECAHFYRDVKNKTWLIIFYFYNVSLLCCYWTIYEESEKNNNQIDKKARDFLVYNLCCESEFQVESIFGV